MLKYKLNIPSYDDILVNWERSKPDFMLWLSEVCGVDDALYIELDRVVKDDKCVGKWIHWFDGDFDRIRETTDLYMGSRNK